MYRVIITAVLALLLPVSHPGTRARHHQPPSATPNFGAQPSPLPPTVYQQVTTLEPGIGHGEWATLIVGLLTLGAVTFQAGAAANAVKTANRALMITMRPRLIVRRIVLKVGTWIPTAGEADAEPWLTNFEIANVGQGVAHVLCYAFTIDRFPDSIPGTIDFPSKEVDRFALQAGETKSRYVEVPAKLTALIRMILPSGLRQGNQHTDKIFFFGELTYADDLGIRRNVSVFRRYDNASELFVPVDDSDREFSD